MFSFLSLSPQISPENKKISKKRKIQLFNIEKYCF
ncbi:HYPOTHETICAL PROTEIN MCJ_006760 [Mesomycoplasma conjunctivae]|uniref:Uncharacterized protein n=1 Tax=Mesomycoplasma conjunctivae (strain ATCC 25834 / NCTC 10147 / HRC/581) TaxID=572263 RepID=C5J7A7_MESCH|nr:HYPOTHETICAL PROTEIN MCJ_006760 [Mesomycoplasma conjunctivae]